MILLCHPIENNPDNNKICLADNIIQEVGAIAGIRAPFRFGRESFSLSLANTLSYPFGVHICSEDTNWPGVRVSTQCRTCDYFFKPNKRRRHMCAVENKSQTINIFNRILYDEMLIARATQTQTVIMAFSASTGHSNCNQTSTKINVPSWRVPVHQN